MLTLARRSLRALHLSSLNVIFKEELKLVKINYCSKHLINYDFKMKSTFFTYHFASLDLPSASLLLSPRIADCFLFLGCVPEYLKGLSATTITVR